MRQSMLARTAKRSRQALKIAEKWKTRLAGLDREDPTAKQAMLWQEEHYEIKSGCEPSTAQTEQAYQLRLR